MPPLFKMLFMAFSDNKVKLDNLKAFEGSTLKNFNSSTNLGLASNDAEMASEAKKEAKLGILDKTDKLYHNGTYSSRDALLNALDAVDDDDLIERLMALKFLEMFFADQHIGETDGGDKAVFYESKYNSELPQVVSYLTSRLDKPKERNIPKYSR